MFRPMLIIDEIDQCPPPDPSALSDRSRCLIGSRPRPAQPAFFFTAPARVDQAISEILRDSSAIGGENSFALSGMQRKSWIRDRWTKSFCSAKRSRLPAGGAEIPADKDRDPSCGGDRVGRGRFNPGETAAIVERLCQTPICYEGSAGDLRLPRLGTKSAIKKRVG